MHIFFFLVKQFRGLRLTCAQDFSPIATSFLFCAAPAYYFLSERERKQLKLGKSEVSEMMNSGFLKPLTLHRVILCLISLSFFFLFFPLASGATKGPWITFYSFAVIGAVVAFLLNCRLQPYKARSLRGVMKAIFNCTWGAGHDY